MLGVTETAAPEPVHRGRQAPAKPQPVKVAEVAQPRPRPAFVSATPKEGERDMTATGSIHPARGRFAGHPGSATTHYSGSPTATPSTTKRSAGRAEPPEPVTREGQGAGHGGWAIQIGATPTLAEANALLARAKGQSRGALASARPFTEKVQKGRETLYRARFAGLQADKAEAVCRGLKHSGLPCIAMKD